MALFYAQAAIHTIFFIYIDKHTRYLVKQAMNTAYWAEQRAEWSLDKNCSNQHNYKNRQRSNRPTTLGGFKKERDARGLLPETIYCSRWAKITKGHLPDKIGEQNDQTDKDRYTQVG